MAVSRKKPLDPFAALLAYWPAELADGAAIEVGLSGGLDSMVLLDLLWRCREQRHFHLCAVHVHHGLSPHADEWVAHCRAACQARDIPLRVERVSVRPEGGESLEAVAREARYQVYRQSTAAAVALAHHRDDQAETVLLQLLRGGGPHALAAMPALRRLDARWLWRPLLSWSRRELAEYAAARALTWVDDESNADTRWRRNLLRHDILPLIETAVPDYRQHLQRSAQMMAQAAQILDEVADQDLDACLQQSRLLLSRLGVLSPPRQRQLLARWLKRLAAGEVGPDALEDFRRQLFAAGPDRNPRLSAATVDLFRYRDLVWAVPRQTAPLPALQPLGEVMAAGDMAFAGGRLTLVPHEQGIARALLAAGATLRPRDGGERLRLTVGRKPVKTLLQEAGIPPVLRQRWPLLYLADGRLAAVPSVAVAADCRGPDGVWPLWLPQ
ncbi:MAG: tRNA lysidine(34) synthetase TilS [Paludibacterium sp.]|uniref:tRNA lysidine(34) synthetase TilS n=1 Tax=Paludibacterium sp. TaxID=1917523 RepID=UPI0025EFFD58|nr:tRNA lysidine(34) synthetase TilS [Paludibacterium sp.]MBV8049376.1 tRNA lysidine(34) synthetase TilS [Paludibacterium sp.]MBV8647542.1 tRNA lysidine(34) synthetase TilS [Paludibacterium sp.]